ncbi:MAG: hypothetical protein DMG28_00475 [Acidobacteria bacterium]|nr:MAG: hypothetical protein DMG28_00475 [Acidobacteriota bacterium]
MQKQGHGTQFTANRIYLKTERFERQNTYHRGIGWLGEYDLRHSLFPVIEEARFPYGAFNPPSVGKLEGGLLRWREGSSGFASGRGDRKQTHDTPLPR